MALRNKKTAATPDEAVRLNVAFSGELAKAIAEMAEATDSTKTAVIRRAIALMKLAHEEKAKGRHLGFAKNSEQLDTEIVGTY
jgi:hypothetical protein